MKNKQLKELCEQAGMECSLGHWYIEDEHLERFAELVRQDEREACAKLIEDFEPESFYLGQLKNAAKAIRQRGEK